MFVCDREYYVRVEAIDKERNTFKASELTFKTATGDNSGEPVMGVPLDAATSVSTTVALPDSSTEGASPATMETATESSTAVSSAGGPGASGATDVTMDASSAATGSSDETTEATAAVPASDATAEVTTASTDQATEVTVESSTAATMETVTEASTAATTELTTSELLLVYTLNVFVVQPVTTALSKWLQTYHLDHIIGTEILVVSVDSWM